MPFLNEHCFLFYNDDLSLTCWTYKGINVVKRKLAEHDNLKITIEQNGDKFHIKESSTFRNKEIDFTLGAQFDYTLADGTEVSVSSVCLRRDRGMQIWAPGIKPAQKPLLIPAKPWCALISGSVGDGGRHDEREVHQKG